MPHADHLLATANMVLKARPVHGVICVFDNGFYTFAEDGRITVNGVDRCGVLKWTFCNDETTTVTGKDVDDLPWEMPLEIAASNRLERNANGVQSKIIAFSIDSPESNNNPAFSTRPEHEIREEELEHAMYRQSKIHQVQLAMEKEKPVHRKMIAMYGFDGKTQKEIAEVFGVSQQAVQKVIDRFRRKIERKNGKCK